MNSFEASLAEAVTFGRQYTPRVCDGFFVGELTESCDDPEG
jgi:hypothetical protein